MTHWVRDGLEALELEQLLVQLLDLVGRHDAELEGARFVGASFAHVSAPCIGPEESPAEAGLRSTVSAFPFRFKTLTQELWFQPGVGRPKQETIMPRELIEPRTGDKRYVRLISPGISFYRLEKLDAGPTSRGIV
jgi:hypothetical protein